MLANPYAKESKLLTPPTLKIPESKEIATPLMAKNDCSGCFKEYGLQTFAKQKLRGLC
jgi:hypothetical protein